jgi:hypothetical protein
MLIDRDTSSLTNDEKIELTKLAARAKVGKFIADIGIIEACDAKTRKQFGL